MLQTEFYIVGGTLPKDAVSYVVRAADNELLQGLQQGQFCYVLTSRQMGKSSLMVRTVMRLRQQDIACAVLDLTAVGQNLSPEQWYDGLINLLGKQLHLEAELDDFWLTQERLGPAQRFFTTVQDVILPAMAKQTPTGRLVVFVDEIDAVRSLPFSADEFFAGIRACYNRRAEDPAFQNLTFCLLGVASPSDLIQDTRTTPFNMGKRIELHDFTVQEASALAAGLGDKGRKLMERVLYWTDGHPYLTQRLCQSLAARGATSFTDVDNHCAALFLSERAQVTDDNLLFVRERLLRSDADLASLLDFYGQIWKGKTVANNETNPLVALLKLAGLVKAQGNRLVVRNRLYARVFDKTWVQDNLPFAELMRQRKAYRQGLLRAASLAGIIVAVVSVLAVMAFVNGRRADQNADAARREADNTRRVVYFANMSAAQWYWEADNTARVVDLLRETQDFKERGFEWGYWDRLCHPNIITLTGHSGGVAQAAYSSDGKRIVTAGWDGTARIWDAATGSQLRVLQPKEQNPVEHCMVSAVFSPDGTTVATIQFQPPGLPDRLTLWNAATGREIWTTYTQQVMPHLANKLAFSPNGRLIVVADGRSAGILEAKTGRRLTSLRAPAPITTAVFSPDNRTVLVSCDDYTAKIYDVATGRKRKSFGNHESHVRSAAFSRDGKRVLAGSLDGTASVWNIADGRLVSVFRGHPAFVLDGAFSRSGDYIATAGQEGITRLWHTETGEQWLTLRGHTNVVLSLCFSPDGEKILTSSLDGTAKIWQKPTYGNARYVDSHPEAVMSVAFSPDETRYVVGCNDSTATVYDLARSRRLFTLKPHAGKQFIVGQPLGLVAYSSDGRYIATGHKQPIAVLWDAATGKKLRTLGGHGSTVYAVKFSPDNKILYTLNRGGQSVRAWDVTTGRELPQQSIKAGAVTVFAVSPDGRRMVTGCNIIEKQIKDASVYDVQTGRLLFRLKGHDWVVSAIAFSPDGRHIATASFDSTARIWDAQTGKLLWVLKGHQSFVTSVCFSPDGKRIATGSFDKTAKLWNVADGRELLTIRGHRRWVMALAFSPDGKFLVTTSHDGTVRVWSSVSPSQ